MSNKKHRISHPKEYLNDFKLNDENKYEYQGKVYELLLNEAEMKAFFKRLLGMTIALDLSILVSGFLNIDAFRGDGFYVLFAYILEIIFIVLLSKSIYSFYNYRKELREYRYKKYYERIKPYSYMTIGTSVLSVVGIIAFYIANPNPNDTLLVIVFIILKIFEFFFSKKIFDLSLTAKFK